MGRDWSAPSASLTGRNQSASVITFTLDSRNNSTPSFTSTKRAPSNRWSERAFGTRTNCPKRILSKCNQSVTMNEVRIPAGRAMLDGNLTLVDQKKALVLFAHGSGSSRHSPRNQFVARTLNEAGLATLLFDLLTPEEESVDLYTREHRFNIGLLAERLVHA